MVSKALLLMKTVFESCVEWFGQLLDAVDGAGVLIAAFIVVLVVSLFLMPLRGAGVSVGGFRDYASQALSKNKGNKNSRNNRKSS